MTLLRRRPLLDPTTLPEDLGVDWSRWADGRAYRLKKKKDFPNVDPGHARMACEHAAAKMGKTVRTVRDKMVPAKLIWIQFADYEIREGEPCPRCGSRTILRLHAGFGRCPNCKAQLMLSQEGLESVLNEDEPAAAQGPRVRQKFVDRIRDLSHVRLEHTGETGETGLYNGYGEEADGSRVLVLAEFLADEEELTTENMFERLTLAKVLPSHLFEGLVDFDALAARPETDWDLIL